MVTHSSKVKDIMTSTITLVEVVDRRCGRIMIIASIVRTLTIVRGTKAMNAVECIRRKDMKIGIHVRMELVET